MPKKPCTVCSKVLSLQQYNKNSGTKDGRGSQCKRCDIEQSARRQQGKKRKLIEMFGGGCSRCGYDKCPTALDFHHPNEDKETNVANLRRYSFDKAVKEAKKCILLCANCHREEHYVDHGPLLGRRRKISGCGTLAGYKKCGSPKCSACKAAKRRYMRKYMRKYRSGGRGGNRTHSGATAH